MHWRQEQRFPWKKKWMTACGEKYRSCFKRLQEIWSEKEAESKKDKQQMKELISDISHQTKTPIANLKVYLELLQAGDLDEKETAEFLNRMEQQTKKLDFLIQSMVKMSRLETGIIEIRKKDVSVYDTLYRAVSAIVPRPERNRWKSMWTVKRI